MKPHNPLIAWPARHTTCGPLTLPSGDRRGRTLCQMLAKFSNRMSLTNSSCAPPWRFLLFQILLIATADSLPGQPQDHSEPAISTPAIARPGHQFLGMNSCYNCHARSERNEDLAAELGLQTGDTWIAGNEMQIWSGRGGAVGVPTAEPADAATVHGKSASPAIDRHAQAYTSLLSETAVRIGQMLGRPAHRDQRCLACHSAMPMVELSTETSGLVDQKFLTDVRLTSGVSCEGCHGTAGPRISAGAPNAPAVVESGWGTEHFTAADWRFRSPDAKHKSGYANLKSIRHRTQICLSCHSGNARLGRVLTHEMYAAGHPPLPPFELETFQNQMPKHWREYHEKDPELRRRYELETGYVHDGEALSATRNTLVAALMTYSESLRLTADLAEGMGAAADTTADVSAGWPELARFDCYACHHDLRHEGWRKAAQAHGRPGRPRLLSWPNALAAVAFATLDPQQDPWTNHAPVHQATLKVPFGDRQSIIQTARSAADTAEAAAKRLEALSFRTAEASLATQQLLGIASTRVVDYDSARSLAWALTAFEQERRRDDPSDTDPGIVEGADLFPGLYLRLQQGRSARMQIPGASQSRPVLLVDPAQTLPPAAAYDPHAFQQTMRTLQTQTPEASPTPPLSNPLPSNPKSSPPQ